MVTCNLRLLCEGCAVREITEHISTASMKNLVSKDDSVYDINKLPENYHQIFEDFKARWRIEDASIDIFQKYPEWLNKMPEELAEIVNSLMAGFDYYTHRNVNERLVLLHQKLQSIQEIDFDNTIYCALPNKEGRINSGYEYLIEYKMINNLSRYVVYPDLKSISSEEMSHIQNIVFVDDFCGTGKTLVDYVNIVEDLIQGKDIYYLVVHTMKNALKRLTQYQSTKSFRIHVIYQICTGKAFERGFEPSNKRQDYKRLAVEYGLPSKNVLGFYNTEALVSFYNDTPNNTLEIFWKDTKENEALFPRKNDEKPSWKDLNKKKKIRNNSNYLNGCNK